MEVLRSSTEKSGSPVSAEVDKFLDELIPSLHLGTPDLDRSEDSRVLYELLDAVPHGRKVMNRLFHSGSGSDIRKTPYGQHNSHLQRAASSIAEQWFEEEKRASSQVTPATLQLDAPVIFSWSKKAGSIKGATTSSDSRNFKESTAGETTNQILFRSISSKLSKIVTQREDLHKRSNENVLAQESERSQHSNGWADSQFRVDPLQPFVAKALPKESRRETSARKKTNHTKRRSLLNFWSSNSKRKDKEKESREAKPEELVNNEKLPDESEQGLSPLQEPSHDSRMVLETLQVSNKAEKLPELPDNAEVTVGDAELPAPTQLQPPSSPARESSVSTLSMNSFIPLQPTKKTNRC